ncbi:S1 RNA-binding domain-containing protein [bacterium]|nr:S1 RNA-binding domain-containing protein [bacterium]
MSLSVKQLKEDPWKTVAERFKVSDTIKGKITNITDFGIFVQLIEGVDGLVHISDISWTEHVSHPGDRYKKGDVVEAVILSLDPENRKISLGIKQLEKDPWTTVASEYKVGDMVDGVVSKITNFGAFVKLGSGIEGLVHISELSENNDVEKIEDMLQVGQAVKLRVIKVSPEDRKLGLSFKAQREGGDQGGREAKPRQAREQRADRSAERKDYRNDYEPVRQKEVVTKNALQQALEEHMKNNKSE